MPDSSEKKNFLSRLFAKNRNPNKLEQELRVPLTLQMREVAQATMSLADQHTRKYQENEESILTLNSMLRTHPEDLSFMIEKEEAFRRANLAAIHLVKIRKVEDLCQRLIAATGVTGNAFTKIDLKDDAFTSDLILSLVFKGLKYALSIEGRQNSIDDIVSIGKRDGVQEFLDALELPGKPLIPYQRNVAERIIRLAPTYDNKAHKGMLQTKIRGVTVQYVYPISQRTPIMSVEVTRIY